MYGFFSYSINVERISSSIHLFLKCVAYCGNCLICISKYFLMPQYCCALYDARSAIFPPKFFVKRNNKSLFIFFSGCCKTLQILHGERSWKYQFYCHCFSGKWLKKYFILFYSYYLYIYFLNAKLMCCMFVTLKILVKKNLLNKFHVWFE